MSNATLELVEAHTPERKNEITLTDNSPAGMMMTALQNGASLDHIEKMMDLQLRWEKREAEKAFRVDFAAFRGANIIIPKSKYVDRGRAGSFHQAEYDEVCRRISPALSEHGLSFRHDQKFGSRKWMTDGVESDVPWVYVTCYLEHKAGHAETLTLEGPPGDLSANTATQNMQVTASYLKRQSLLAITGTATGGEDDENKMIPEQGDEVLFDVVAALNDVESCKTVDAITEVWTTQGAKAVAAKDMGGHAMLKQACQEMKARLLKTKKAAP